MFSNNLFQPVTPHRNDTKVQIPVPISLYDPQTFVVPGDPILNDVIV